MKKKRPIITDEQYAYLCDIAWQLWTDVDPVEDPREAEKYRPLDTSDGARRAASLMMDVLGFDFPPMTQEDLERVAAYMKRRQAAEDEHRATQPKPERPS